MDFQTFEHYQIIQENNLVIQVSTKYSIVRTGICINSQFCSLTLISDTF